MTALLIFPQIGYSLSCGYTNNSAAAKLKNTIFTHKKVLNRLFPAQNDAEKIKQRIVASSAAIPNLTPKKG
ncbi:MAG: hypothetical protein Q7U98_07415 [Methylicorpusculum sp.]|uniref:hypothetical protein n=1 Tax=Methylicorpusculum sp. TaxID=2713644 RepID=UPI002715A7F7|nr:hypothetical protein [Methylicorpusculum sp.]MDO8844153.1 hypothetical protein [Methylicorpusculum sp.]MDO8938973.1 hypothetical protein [Methylicorpusculum sp.]MDP2203103.1 hypothetical protein [Methylicorpusculum sp.]